MVIKSKQVITVTQTLVFLIIFTPISYGNKSNMRHDGSTVLTHLFINTCEGIKIGFLSGSVAIVIPSLLILSQKPAILVDITQEFWQETLNRELAQNLDPTETQLIFYTSLGVCFLGFPTVFVITTAAIGGTIGLIIDFVMFIYY